MHGDWGDWWTKLRALPRRRRALSDLDEELDTQFDMAVDELIDRGMSPDEARTAARRRLGHRETTRARTHDAWRFLALDAFLQDLRYAARNLRHAPGFAAIVILTLALGIGATTAIFSVVYTVLLQPLPYPHGERLVWIGESTGRADGISVTWGNYQQWREHARGFDGLAGFDSAQATWTGRGEARLLRLGTVTHDLFTVLGVQPLMGRLLRAEDDVRGAPPTIVLSHQFWSMELGSDPRVLDTALTLDGRLYRVVGVLPAGWSFIDRPADGFIALGARQTERTVVRRDQHGSMRLVGRLAPGATLETARADLDALMTRLGETDPGPESDHRSGLRPLAGNDARGSRTLLWTLMAAVGVMLLIACVNVTNLVLARSATRTRELAIRAAIGAGRFRIGRQLLTEQLFLATLGGLAGLALAHWGLALLVHAAPTNIPRLASVQIDRHVLAFTALLTIITAVIVGLAPLMTAGRLDLLPALNEGGRSAGGRSRHTQWVARTLVIAEIAMTLVLALGCALLVRSLIAAERRDPGFAADGLLAVDVVLPAGTYAAPEAIRGYFERMTADLGALPGVTGTTAVTCQPSTGGCMDWFYSLPDRPAPARGDVPLAFVNIADTHYFETLRIPLRAGRAFSETDRPGGPPVAIVNDAFARRWYPSSSPIGQRIKMGGPYIEGATLEIVGVAGDVSQIGLDSEAEPEIYMPAAQSSARRMTVMVRTSQGARETAAMVRHAVAAIDPNVPIQRIGMFDVALRSTLDSRRFGTALLTLFAGVALLLAFVGIYGLLSAWVAMREGEIAIRMALGANRTTIARWTGAEAVRLCLTGIIVGGGAGWLAARSLEGLLFGVSASSPSSFAWAIAAIVGMIAAAAVRPLWRATHVEAIASLQR